MTPPQTPATAEGGWTAHTPGPWHAFETHLGAAFDIGAANGANVAIVSGISENGADEYEANACLVSAAPDLLAALDAVMSERWSPTGRSEYVSDLARAALAKARGEAR